MSVLLEEQETHINFSRLDERAGVYTSDSTMITKLDKLVSFEGTEWKLEHVHKLQNGEVVGKTYSCPVEFISFRSKHVKRTLTEEQRQQMAERMKALRQNK